MLIVNKVRIPRSEIDTPLNQVLKNHDTESRVLLINVLQGEKAILSHGIALQCTSWESCKVDDLQFPGKAGL